ncbi:RNA polymerase sigma factor [Pedobacter arcticus]|uniref:RNA polymerase sigma factor n=1 Tax=Pedobacter arcticus TaxID=752140 RepID=UPI0003024195|nr:sigma-70 family RNA polymerase sigma factor [Pedobacter arcticus]
MAQPQLTNLDHSLLLTQLKCGNQDAFTELYKMYSVKLYVNILRMVKDEQVAEELVQELFTKIWRKRESLQINIDFKSYLYVIGQNLVYDFFRKLQRDQKMYQHFKEIATEQYSHIEESLQLKQSEDILEKALSKLSVQQRNVYKLCKIEGYTYKQAADKMGISPHTVKEYLSIANRFVKEYLLNNLDICMTLLLFFFIKK